MQQSLLFIGLGAMGDPMARRLASHYALHLFDVDEDRLGSLAEEISAISVPDAVAAAPEMDIVVLMLPSSAIVESLVLDGGLLASMPTGSLLIDMGSSRPDSSRNLAAMASDSGIHFVDAPVSGGRRKAATGELTIMMGGSAEAKDRARAVVSHLGTNVFDTGAAGTGDAMKALNNLLSATGILAAAEVLAAGARFGLSPTVMLDVLNHSTGRNQATEVKFAPFILSRTFDSGFALDLMVKDLSTAASLLVDQGQPSPTRSAISGWEQARLYLDDPAADHTAIAQWVEKLASIQLRDEGPRP